LEKFAYNDVGIFGNKPDREKSYNWLQPEPRHWTNRLASRGSGSNYQSPSIGWRCKIKADQSIRWHWSLKWEGCTGKTIWWSMRPFGKSGVDVFDGHSDPKDWLSLKINCFKTLYSLFKTLQCANNNLWKKIEIDNSLMKM